MNITFIERSPGVWRLRIETGKDEDGKRLFKYETLHGTEDNARQRRWELLTAHEDGTFTAPEKLTLSAYFATWKKNRQAIKKVGRSTADTYATWFRIYVAPTLGGKRVQKITGAEIQNLYTELMSREGDDALSVNTVVCVHKMLAKVLRDARKAKIIKTNPMEEVDAPGREKTKPKAIEADKVLPLMVTLEGNWKQPIAYLGFGAGMRRGELCGLRWRYVGLDAAKIEVGAQLVEYRDRSYEWLKPKTEAGFRTVSIDESLVAMLRRLKAEAMRNYLALGMTWTEDAYVFTDDGVLPIRPSKLTKSFSDHCDAHGLPDFTFHGTRHTHLTELLRNVGREGARAVQERAGHADITTTLGTYQAVFESDDRNLAGLAQTLTKGAK